MQGEIEARKQTTYLANLFLPVQKSKHFRFLWVGQLFSILGSSITMVILPVVVYSLTGSTVVMGTTMTMYMLPNVLVLPFSGLIVDRLNRVNVMLFTDIVRFILMVAAMVLVLSDALTIHILYGLVAIYGLMDGLFQPAYAAVRAQVFVPEIRNAANALTQMSHQGVRLIGPALGGLIVSAASAGIGFGLDAITYLLSFICLLFIRDLTSKTETKSEAYKFNMMKDFAEGVAVLKSQPWLWVTILAFSFINICYAGIIVVLIPWLFNVHYDFDPFIYGLAMAFSGGGAVLAAFIFGSRQKWKRRGLIAYGGVLLSGLALLAMPFVTWAPGLVGLLAIEGFGIMMFALVWETSLQELVPEEAFGRVASLDMLGSFALLPLGYLLTGWLADVIGGITTITYLAVAALAIVAVALSVPSIRRFD
ncbi:MFS transporter [Bacillus sp. T33-2]|uniref:MFS transporter n=1 Tax=Bacillus sp. T33-2 TaxID=2054168 RepID=UPI000C776466|nr:MFS transporter [Bacillus sp. T33-2]PLR94135.1 MFS transporter [Bacillus sp. T33-2]